jgi:hypothetical protein
MTTPQTGIIAVIVRPDLLFIVAVVGFALGFSLSVRPQRHRMRDYAVRFVIVPLVLAAFVALLYLRL